MTKTWVISGARKGVGKTHLAKHLCAVLPSSVYAKCGQGKTKPGKSEHFFNREEDLEAFVGERSRRYEHMVIESNANSETLRSDINIFLEARATAAAAGLRPEAAELRAKADIRINGGDSRREWKKVLDRFLGDNALVDTVLDVLTEQQRWLDSRPLGIRSKIWFVDAEGRHVFGAGLAQILVEVEHLGSLKTAAKRINVPLPRVRKAIRDAENLLGIELLRPDQKGTGEEGLTLTPAGKRVLAVYLRLNEEAAAYVDDTFAAALQRELSQVKKLMDARGARPRGKNQQQTKTRRLP